jgi:hypothetical protein
MPSVLDSFLGAILVAAAAAAAGRVALFLKPFAFFLPISYTIFLPLYRLSLDLHPLLDPLRRIKAFTSREVRLLYPVASNTVTVSSRLAPFFNSIAGNTLAAAL